MTRISALASVTDSEDAWVVALGNGPVKTISQSRLRNRIGQVLRQVEAGERLRVTVHGRPVADLVPIGGARRTFVRRADFAQILSRAPLDRAFGEEIDTATGATVDEI